MLDFRILGPLEVSDAGEPIQLHGQKQRALLALLLLEPNRVVSTDALIDALWDSPPDTAAKALQGYVSQVRRAIGAKRTDIIRLFVMETTLIAVAGGTMGLLLLQLLTHDGAASITVVDRNERRLELAMEGQRFFDLRRRGDADSVLTNYVAVEKDRLTWIGNGAPFASKHHLYPIPQIQIELSHGALCQNAGWGDPQCP